jgi:SnoaL-like domain
LKKAAILSFVILTSTFLHAQKEFSNDQLKIQQAVVKMFDALSSRDSVALKTYCSSDIALYEYGQVWNLDTLIRKAIRTNKSVDFKRTNTFEFISTTKDKTTAWVTYHLQSAIIRDDKQVTVRWLETVILVKEKKQWKVKHLHSTLIKRS